ncbi:hypothetical protein F2P56_030290 [Juglans regia]|uniref:glucan endo-1,3-beta-D-glucosidase n=1 Tax=Juglans regia TaxID=51240 RepID=A0A833WXI0_JUGRE|nr:hypothetical protein F2P56_030290 [Juglans regia]
MCEKRDSLVWCLAAGLGLSKTAAPIGICYGRVANNLTSPSLVIDLLKSNNIRYACLFDADPTTLKSFSGTRINLVIGAPNKILPSLASSPTNASLDWLRSNIFAHVTANQVRYIAVGNEVLFLKDQFYTPYVVPAILNLYQALQTLGLTDSIKLSSPQATSVVVNPYPTLFTSLNLVGLEECLRNVERRMDMDMNRMLED